MRILGTLDGLFENTCKDQFRYMEKRTSEE